MSSLSRAEVIQVGEIKPHPNADRLDLTEVFGMTVCLGKDSFIPGQLAVYVPPDMVSTGGHPALEFLGKETRIRAKKIRGIVSQGLLIPATENHSVGDDATEEFGLIPYEHKIKENTSPRSGSFSDGKKVQGPSGDVKYTDVESLKRYHQVLIPGEAVVLTEKIEGENSRYVWQDGKLHIGTRKRWIVAGDDVWGRVATKYSLEEKLSHYENLIFFGEVFGHVGGFAYGRKEPDLVFFDIYSIELGRYLDYHYAEFIVRSLGLEFAPILYEGPWSSLEDFKYLAEGNSLVSGASNMREGFVVRPVKERWDQRIGRVILKLKGDGYMLRNS